MKYKQRNFESHQSIYKKRVSIITESVSISDDELFTKLHQNICHLNILFPLGNEIYNVNNKTSSIINSKYEIPFNKLKNSSKVLKNLTIEIPEECHMKKTIIKDFKKDDYKVEKIIQNMEKDIEKSTTTIKTLKIRSLSEEVSKITNLIKTDEYDQILRRLRRKINIEIIRILLNLQKEYKNTNSSSYEKIFLADINKILLEFLLTSTYKLKSRQCRDLFHRVEQFERQIIDKLKLIFESPIHSEKPVDSPLNRPKSSMIRPSPFKPLIKEDGMLGSSRLEKKNSIANEQNSVPSVSPLKSMFPQLFKPEINISSPSNRTSGSSNLNSPKNVSPLLREISKFMKRSNSKNGNFEGNQLLMRILRSILQIKYLFSMLGYIFHYNNMALGFLDKEDFGSPNRKRSNSGKPPHKKSSFSDSGDFSPMLGKRIFETEKTGIFFEEYPNKAIQPELPILEPLIHQEIIKLIEKIKLEKEISDSMEKVIYKLKGIYLSYNYCLEEKAISNIKNYFKWKFKKWQAQTKIEMRQSVLIIMENEEIVCKICEKKVLAKKMKDHSVSCKIRTEVKTNLKAKSDLINTKFLPWLLEDRRSFSLQNILLKNKFKKIQQKILNPQLPKTQFDTFNYNKNKSNERSPCELDQELYNFSDDDTKREMRNSIIEVPKYKDRRSIFESSKTYTNILMNDEISQIQVSKINNINNIESKKLFLKISNSETPAETKKEREFLNDFIEENNSDSSSNSSSSVSSLVSSNIDSKKMTLSIKEMKSMEINLMTASGDISDTKKQENFSLNPTLDRMNSGDSLFKNIIQNKIEFCQPKGHRNSISVSGSIFPKKIGRRESIIINKKDMDEVNLQWEVIKNRQMIKENSNKMSICETFKIMLQVFQRSYNNVIDIRKLRNLQNDSYEKFENLKKKKYQFNPLFISNMNELQDFLKDFIKDLESLNDVEKKIQNSQSTNLSPSLFKENTRKISKFHSESPKNKVLERSIEESTRKVVVENILDDLGVEIVNSETNIISQKEIVSANQMRNRQKHATVNEECKFIKMQERRKTLLEESIKKSLKITGPFLEDKKTELITTLNNIDLDLFHLTGKWITLSDGGSPYFNKFYRNKFKKLFIVKDDSDLESEKNNFSENQVSKQSIEEEILDESIETGIKDFDFIKLISKGAFGRVWLVRRKSTKDYYAMKIVNFAEKMSKNHLDCLNKENQILKIVSSDFVVKALFTFTYENYICFVMEYMYGGDLGSLLEKYGCFDEEQARFYIAETILAVESLHLLNIIHRDLKPDNILLDSDGHTKLTDFGLSDLGFFVQKKKKEQEINTILKSNQSEKKINFSFHEPQKTKTLLENNFVTKIPSFLKNVSLNSTEEIPTINNNISKIPKKLSSSKNNQKMKRMIGTPDYMAPEVLDGEGLKNPGIDWWSVGVMLFEFLVGIPPFNDLTPEKIFDNIKNNRVPWDDIPEGGISENAKDLIKRLMEKDPKKRYGVKEIKKHPFFSKLDWDNVRNMKAFIIPEIKDVHDTSNFEKTKNYEELEKVDPFYGAKNSKIDVFSKQMLNSNVIRVKRYDLLDAENQKKAINLEETRKLIEEEVKKEEKVYEECFPDSGEESSFESDESNNDI